MIAYILRLIYNDQIKNFEIKDFLFIVFISILLSLSKQLYILIPLISILIPLSKFKSLKIKAIFISFLMILSIIPSMLWSFSASKFYSGQEIIKNQIELYSSNLFLFFKETFYEYAVGGFYLYEHFIGQLGWLDTRLPFFFVILPFTILFVLLLFSQKSSEKMFIN